MPLQVVPLSQSSLVNPNVLSAPPSLISRPTTKHALAVGSKPTVDDKKSTGATIEAKPQLRNLSADVTKFMPTSLRVKREDKIVRKKEQRLIPLGELLGTYYDVRLSGITMSCLMFASNFRLA